MLTVHEINLQRITGGGEYYTRAFSRALADCGARVRLYVNRDNAFWETLADPRIEIVPLRTVHELENALPTSRSLLIAQTLLPSAIAQRLRGRHVLACFAHMPLHGRRPEPFFDYSTVVTVSRHCLDQLLAAGIRHAYPEPIYGTYDLDRAHVTGIVSASPYDWDRRKLRDRALGVFHRLVPGRRVVYEKREGLTLGVVSLLVPIKQFPVLFSLIAPVIARLPGVWLEIFGSGGYAQVRDMRAALQPIADRVRWWGYQPAVQAVYGKLDYLLAGLPEKEALGLNVIEAQACGLPVLAPDAAPFTETVIDGVTGFLYRDPRGDGGAAFGELLGRLAGGASRPRPELARSHLARFSFDALRDRTRRLLAYLEERLGT